MTTAQSRAIKDLTAEKDALLDVLVGILHKEGGIVRVPWNVMTEARRAPIKTYLEDGDLVVSLDAVLVPAKPTSRLRRFFHV